MPTFIAVCIPKQILESNGSKPENIVINSLKEEHHKDLVFHSIQATTKEYVQYAVTKNNPNYVVLHIREEA